MNIQDNVRRYIQNHEDMEHLRELSFGCEGLQIDLHWYITGDEEPEDVEKRRATVCEYGETVVDANPGGMGHEQWEVPYVWLLLEEPYTDCEQAIKRDLCDIQYTIIGRPPRLNDYLAVLGMEVTNIGYECDQLIVQARNGKLVLFSLKTGEPETESDWKTYAELVVIES